MARKAYPRRYAQAIFKMALEKKELERWQADLQKLTGAVADAVVLEALESPKLRLEDKTKLLAGVLEGVNPLARNLVSLLIIKRGVGMLGQIAEEYQRLLDDYHGIAPAEVVTAVPLDDKDVKKLSENLGALVGKEVVLKAGVDESIIGGIVARIGGKLLDGSTRSKLEALRRDLVGMGRRR